MFINTEMEALLSQVAIQHRTVPRVIVGVMCRLSVQFAALQGILCRETLTNGMNFDCHIPKDPQARNSLTPVPEVHRVRPKSSPARAQVNEARISTESCRTFAPSPNFTVNGARNTYLRNECATR
jgi:hypothetical protein